MSGSSSEGGSGGVSGSSGGAGGAGDVLAPQLLAPLPTATVTTQMPTLHWLLADGTTGARVELCRDRACTMMLDSFDALGSSGRSSMQLSPGVVYWRLHGESGGTVGMESSPVWQFNVGHRSALVDTSWGTAPQDFDGDGFDDLVVGAKLSDAPLGRAYLYLGGPSGISSSATPAVTFGVASANELGASVASAGDVDGDGLADILVGAPSANNGNAYLYKGSTKGVSATPSASFAGVGNNAVFGASVSSAGDVDGDGFADVVIGAWNQGGGMSPPGAAYVYRGGKLGLAGTPVTLAPTFSEDIFFGSSVACAGDVDGDGFTDVVVGAKVNGTSMGRVYLFAGNEQGLSTTPTLSFLVDNGGELGPTLAGAGDVNGDGYADVIAGDSDGSIALVYLGSAQGLSTTTLGLASGFSVASAGDANGDGFADVIVGDGSGGAYVSFGGMSGLSGGPVLMSGGLGDEFGAAVATPGDIDGDGIADLAVGAPLTTNQDGAVYLFLGSAQTIGPSAAATLTLADSEQLGGALARAKLSGASHFGTRPSVSRR
jgi:hypothetical protein